MLVTKIQPSPSRIQSSLSIPNSHSHRNLLSLHQQQQTKISVPNSKTIPLHTLLGLLSLIPNFKYLRLYNQLYALTQPVTTAHTQHVIAFQGHSARINFQTLRQYHSAVRQLLRLRNLFLQFEIDYRVSLI
uniref:Uncharacterized protein n=1 Tax=Cacopsylla melanoneura TaxID=428564 RepID=A0A8D8RGX7_9HEMI